MSNDFRLCRILKEYVVDYTNKDGYPLATLVLKGIGCDTIDTPGAVEHQYQINTDEIIYRVRGYVTEKIGV